jgi:hypothetical protein
MPQRKNAPIGSLFATQSEPTISFQAVDKPRTSRQQPLNIRIRYGKRLGKLLRTFDELSIIQLDLDQTISYVLSAEIEKV